MPHTPTNTAEKQRPLAASSTALTEPPAQMRAIIQDRFGSADVLQFSTVDRPTISDDEVLIEVRAAGIDRGVEHLMTGLPYLVRVAGYGFTKPKNPVPGMDVAGVVVAVGSQVTRFAKGDEVFGIANGAFAQFASAPAQKLAHKPANLTFEQGGVAAISGITALQALTDVGRLQSGQRVLVLGASGGVGTYAVQLAKALGAEVTGVASAAKVGMVRSLGADHVIDYASADVFDGKRRYDLILDTGGRNSIRTLRGVLSAHGTLVIVGGEGGNRLTGGVGRQLRAMVLSPLTSQRLTTFISTESHSLIERLADYLASGQVVPVVGQQFELKDAPKAMRQLADGKASGKLVITVSGP